MQCLYCQTDLQPGSKFCSQCAAPIEQSVYSGETTLLAPWHRQKQAQHDQEKPPTERTQLLTLSRDEPAPTPPHENAGKRDEEQEESENERLMIFSDGVIAFALTIAAVSIRIPKDLGELNAIVFTIRLFSYVLSFIFVYSLWKEHHSIFHHIKRNDGWLITLNSLYLALVVLIPVSLNIMDVGLINIATHPGAGLSSNDFYSFLLFLGSLCGASVMLPLMWRHARLKRPQDLFADAKPQKAFLVYTTWRLSMLPSSLLFYIPAYLLIALNYWQLGVGIVIGYTILRWLFFSLYRHRLQRSLDLSTGNEEIMRIQLFSDAVIGIAITIAAAQIDPSFDVNSSSAVATVLSESWSLLGTYIFGFIIMGIYWLLHYHLFRFIKRYDSLLLMLNFVFLLLIILMFIPARMYTSHMYSQQYTLLFSFWQFLTASVLLLMWQHAVYKSQKVHEPRLLKRDGITRRHKRFARIIQVNPFIFLLLAGVSCFLQIPTTLYIGAYLLLLGGTWSVSHWFTRDIMEQSEPEAQGKMASA